MKQWNKLTSALLVATMVLGLAACGKQEQDATQTVAETVSQMTESEDVSETNEQENLQVNLIQNGDFSDGTNYFNTYTNGGSCSLKTNADLQLQVDITNTGAVDYGVQVYYDGFELKQGAEYVFSFDVASTIPRDLQWRVQINGGDYHAYAGETVNATEQMQHVEAHFTMEEASDPAPRLCFNMGASDAVGQEEKHSVMLDNICLMMVDASNLVAQEVQTEAPKVKVNQLGYLPKDTKIAVFSDLAESDSTFQVVDAATGKSVFEGQITDRKWDNSTGENDAKGDFSAVKTPGTYQIVTGEGEKSFSFAIGEDVYQDAFEKVAEMFYLQRCGQELTADRAGAFAHAACHTSMATIYGTNQQIDVSGGWHDAGDYGRYVVPAAKTVADLMLTYERNPSTFAKNLNMLDEIKYELDWMLKMQDSATGGVYHKVTCKNFPGTVMPEEETEELVVAPLSKTASADFAAAMAMASRVYTDAGNKAYGEKCLSAAKRAFSYYQAHMEERGFVNPSDISTGEYGDGNSKEEYFWAAAELYKTTGEQTYLTALQDAYSKTMQNSQNLGGFGWMDMNGYGAYAALTTSNLQALSSTLYGDIEKAFLAAADEAVRIANANSYLVSRESTYEWGSNMGIANNGMLLLLANEISPKAEYAACAKEQLDYLLGVNATGYCFVTGVGSMYPQHPHHRPSQVQKTAVPGMLVGGPDSSLEDPYAKAVLTQNAPAKCYVDNEQSYSCNEVTIYWNSPLVYLMGAYVK